MKILIINSLYYPYKVGGAEVSVKLLAESLAKDSHEVTVATLHDKDSVNIEVINQVTVYRIPIRNIYWPFEGRKRAKILRALWHAIDSYNPFAKKDITELIKKVNPDIVHTNNLSGFSVSAWDAATEQTTPIVHTSRDYYLLHPNSTLFTAGQETNQASHALELIKKLKKRKSCSVKSYIGISNFVMLQHEDSSFFPNASHTVIYNSIDKAQRASGTIKRDHQFKYLGFIGQIEPSKGIEVALNAFEQLDDSFKFYIAGSGKSKYLKYLQQKYQNPRIIWLGHIEPAEFYSNIDILLVPSLWPEPLGRVVLEAYSYGVSVVASDSGGLPEIIRPGITGFVFRNNDHEDARKYIGLALNKFASPNQACIEYSRQFRLEAISASYLMEYERAIANSEPSSYR